MQIKSVSFILFSFFFLTSCGVVNSTIGKGNSGSNKSSNKVLKEAKSYIGTKYQYGGTTRRGMDCSGLVVNAYKAIDLQMPRVSRDQAKEGFKVNLNKVKPGDLLFFNTSGKGVSHVGIVESIKGKEVFFIHSSSSKGVTITSLENRYWKPRFLYAKRVL